MRKIIFIASSIGFIIIAVILFIVFSAKKTTPPDTTIIPTPTLIPISPFISLPPENNISLFEKNVLIEQLPLETPTYNIEYLVESDTFVVTIKQSPYLQHKQAADQFFIQNGVKDLGSLRILYNSYRWVQ